MPQSYILSKLKNVLSHSYFLNFLVRQVDVNEELKYESVITASFYKPIVFLNSLLDWIANHTYIKALSERIDLKSVVIFVFIVSQVLFPGYGTENTGTALLPGSPVGSVANRSGFVLNLLVFVITLSSLGIVFLNDITKNSKAFRLSKFDILIVIFILSIAVSSIFSVYPVITFTWFIKVLRGISIYFIFSRLIIKKKHILTICLAFLSIIYIESFLAIFQYIHGGFVGLPIETAPDIISKSQLYAFINTQFFRPSGTLSQANTLIFILTISLPFSMLLIFFNSKLLKTLGIGTLLLSIISGVITLSRWGAVTLLFCISLFFFLFFWLKIGSLKVRFLVRLFLFLLIVVCTVLAYQSVFTIRLSSLSNTDTSLIARLQLISQAIYIIQHQFLFGIGGGTFSGYLYNFDFTQLRVSQFFPAPVHNTLLLIFSESGVGTLLLFTAIIFYLPTSFFKYICKSHIIKDSIRVVFLISVFVSICVYSLNGLWTLRAIDERLIVFFWMNMGFYFAITRGFLSYPL